MQFEVYFSELGAVRPDNGVKLQVTMAKKELASYVAKKWNQFRTRNRWEPIKGDPY